MSDAAQNLLHYAGELVKEIDVLREDRNNTVAIWENAAKERASSLDLATALLRELEWDEMPISRCPVCQGWRHGFESGHRGDCRLDVFLRGRPIESERPLDRTAELVRKNSELEESLGAARRRRDEEICSRRESERHVSELGRELARECAQLSELRACEARTELKSRKAAEDRMRQELRHYLEFFEGA